MGPIYSLADILDMVRRRIGLISFVIILGSIISVAFALSQPRVYQSAEVIQVEQPKVADELAPSTVEGSPARRMQLIQQQLMARRNLQDIITKYGLYDHLPSLLPAEKVFFLRDSVTISGVAAPSEGYGSDGVISILTITATMDDPELAQKIAHEFADRTRKLTTAQRRAQAAETLAFFQQREQDLIVEINALEDEIVRFRGENNLSIDGTIEFRRSELASLNDGLLELDREIIAAELARSRIDRTARSATVARLESDAQAELESLTTQRAFLQERREALSLSLETSPEVERALANFERRRDQLQGSLDAVVTHRTGAEVGYSVETSDHGERLMTLEEAQVPDFPISASRKKTALAGGIASTLLALVLAFLLELRKPVIRTATQMERETGLLPVISIPRVGKSKKRNGIARIWQDRREAGRRGRDARVARTSRLNRG